MASKAYKHQDTGVVIAVVEGTELAELVTASGKYDEASLDDLAASDVPAFAPGTISTAERDERNGWVTPPGVPAAPITGAVASPSAPGDPLEEVLKGTTEEVNTYLDEHQADVTRVLELEAAGKARKGILEGRHKPAATEDPAATDGDAGTEGTGTPPAGQ